MSKVFNAIATATLAATASSSRVALPGTVRGLQPRTVRVLNQGPDLAFIAPGNSTVTATVAGSMPLLVGVIEVFAAPPGFTHVAAITETGTALLRLTIGEGG